MKNNYKIIVGKILNSIGLTSNLLLLFYMFGLFGYIINIFPDGGWSIMFIPMFTLPPILLLPGEKLSSWSIKFKKINISILLTLLFFEIIDLIFYYHWILIPPMVITTLLLIRFRKITIR